MEGLYLSVRHSDDIILGIEYMVLYDNHIPNVQRNDVGGNDNEILCKQGKRV